MILSRSLFLRKGRGRIPGIHGNGTTTPPMGGARDRSLSYIQVFLPPDLVPGVFPTSYAEEYCTLFGNALKMHSPHREYLNTNNSRDLGDEFLSNSHTHTHTKRSSQNTHGRVWKRIAFPVLSSREWEKFRSGFLV
ncbi:hypothetical protein CEXT_78821 [Caerostris extrusa]|uniref:Uncharacterized protein n=1 Tax=Caerostris extrusa TaxID=172846 RepID=A0AAV4N8Z7_CAEEX|nr:hypothetical protein CEXT_78821 [Caerostris extrusa]